MFANSVMRDTSFLEKSNLLFMMKDYMEGKNLLLRSYDMFYTLVDSLYFSPITEDSLHSEQALPKSLITVEEK